MIIHSLSSTCAFSKYPVLKKNYEILFVYFSWICNFRTFNGLKTTEQVFTEMFNSFKKHKERRENKKWIIYKLGFEENKRELGYYPQDPGRPLFLRWAQFKLSWSLWQSERGMGRKHSLGRCCFTDTGILPTGIAKGWMRTGSQYEKQDMQWK